MAAGCGTASSAAPSPTTRNLTVAIAPSDARATTSSSTVQPAAVPASVEVERDVRYSDAGALDVYRPAKATNPPADRAHPVVVLYGGRTSDKALYSAIAGRLAAAGVVVSVPNYRARDAQTAPAVDARCVVWTAAHRASTAGGDPGAVTLVGYAWGALAAVGEGLDGPWKQVPVDTGDCNAPAATPPVRGVVGVVGQYDFYGTPSSPAAGDFATYSPYSQLAASPSVPIRIVQGQVDALAVAPATSEQFRDAASAAGHPVEYRAVDAPNLSLAGLVMGSDRALTFADAGAGHAGIDAVVDAVLATVGG
jgi:hypothetical protein